MGIGAVAAAASVAASVDSMVSSGGGGGGGSVGGQYIPPAYQPQAQGQADTYYQGLLGQMFNGATSLPGAVSPAYSSYFSNVQGNPYAGGAQTAANNAGAYGTALAGQESNAANAMFGIGQAGSPYASQILQTGFDPQNALYNRTQQQLKDQLNAANASSGLSGTPYGTGVMGQGLENFNIDWQNNLLSREAAATQGYGNLVSGVGRAYAGGTDLGTTAMGTMQSAGQLPYQTFLGNQNDVLNAANNYSGGVTNSYGLGQNAMNAAAAYMKLGQSATSVGQAGQNQAFNQGQTLGANFGAGLQGLSSGISGLAGLFGGGGGVSPSNPINYGGGTYGINADMFGAYPSFDFSMAG